MLNLLAWLFFGWKGLLLLFPQRRKDEAPDGNQARRPVDETDCINVLERPAEHHANSFDSISKGHNLENGGSKMSAASLPVNVEYLYNQKHTWSSYPPSYDSLFSPGAESIEGKEIDPRIEQLLAAASWQAVSDDPSEEQFYKTKKNNRPKRDVIEEDDINPVSNQVSLESGTSYADDVFGLDPDSELNLDGNSPYQSSTPLSSMSIRNRIHQFEGTERTTLVANAHSNKDQFVKSVTVNVSQPVGFQDDNDPDGRDDSGCLSDSLHTPRQYTSSLHTTLHSPYGSQENLAHVSYELGVDTSGHRRLDSWDALNVDRHYISNHTVSTKSPSAEEKTKMTITVRPKSTEISPRQVIISPRTSVYKEDTKFVFSSGSSDNKRHKFSEEREEAPCDASFGHAEMEVDVSMAKVCEQENTKYSVASQSSIYLKQKKGLNDNNHHEKYTSEMGKDSSESNRTGTTKPKQVPLVDRNEHSSEIGQKLPRRPTFDSESHSQLESFYTELGKGMEFGSPPSAKYREFDEIMHKRRRQVDVVDDAGTIFGAFGSRENKLTGVEDTKAKKRWRKIKFAVFSGLYKKL